MEKTEMMKRYEEETDIDAIVPAWAVIYDVERDEICNPEYTSYLEWQLEKAQAKSEAYDRLMSGGKKTLKEWANIFGLPFALGRYSQGIAFKCKSLPVVAGNNWWPTDVGDFGFAFIDRSLIDFTGDWKTSLTFPDGWEDR